MIKSIFAICTIIFAATTASLCQTTETSADSIPQLFEPGRISTKYPNRDIAISPDREEIFYTFQGYKREFSVIMHLMQINGEWMEPVVASFSGQFHDLEPAFAPDGKRLYFASNRPTEEGSKKADYDIWYVDKEHGKWGTPVNVGAPVNTDKNEFYPSVAENGSLYFTAEYEGNKGKEDIYVSRYSDGKYARPESLSEGVNSETYEFNAFVAPDESYIIFSSYGRADDLGGGDLYISMKNEQGEWTNARHLPAPINSEALDYCPFVSADQQYFFFTSNRSKVQQADKYKELILMMESIENGFDNVYWMKADRVLKTH
ncbi:WD40-like beta propeller repeat protein [Fulvivirga imtechensis AK7]|uniref:WD40-like beta propeller repeat protein n=1 Tax=Fulvivirga imtechensis AK7 TaxID=1237149 RepID=L8JKC8_9BACT|nr:PD40 domain-containing protein [Fulvivirga imtechensis]ELR68693.1 WD40-like beta propeller repeat protein [Fulvivirga imtechensis AK7]